MPRSFVHFVLEPFYKVIAVSISEEKDQLDPILRRIGVMLQKKDFSLDIKPLVCLVLRKLLGDISCLVDSMTQIFPSAKAATATKVQKYYLNTTDNVKIQQ